jgi:hypothetical protein
MVGGVTARGIFLYFFYRQLLKQSTNHNFGSVSVPKSVVRRMSVMKVTVPGQLCLGLVLMPLSLTLIILKLQNHS